MSLAKSIKAIDRAGILLVFPQKGRDDVPSLWHALHPRSEMRWAWDEGADARVVELWHLRSALAVSGRVVYTKWLGGRATLFSLAVFRAMLASLRALGDLRRGLARESLALLDALMDSSPRATKELRAAAELEGRVLEGAYTRAMRALWSRLLVVGAGESEEGGFPSLVVGATELLLEDLWNEAATLTDADAALLKKTLAKAPAFQRLFRKVRAELASSVLP